jgi:nucleotide-binding universal stress UspA family protein
MYRRILVAIDNSHGTPHVLDEALKLAGLHPAELHLVTVVNLLELAVEDPRQHDPAQLATLADQHGHTVLAPAKQHAGQHAGPLHTSVRHCWEGGKDIARALLKHARDIHADLIIMGTHGHGALGKLVMGSVSTQVLANCDVPVMLIR